MGRTSTMQLTKEQRVFLFKILTNTELWTCSLWICAKIFRKELADEKHSVLFILSCHITDTINCVYLFCQFFLKVSQFDRFGLPSVNLFTIWLVHNSAKSNRNLLYEREYNFRNIHKVHLKYIQMCHRYTLRKKGSSMILQNGQRFYLVPFAICTRLRDL